MSSTISLSPISTLLEKHLYIPSYQRGYRWNRQQVIDLLNDIYEFAQKPNKLEKEFYCLQPIVVKPHKWVKEEGEEVVEIEGWELVDGQQRLTTLRIILSYLIRVELKGETLKKEYGKDVFYLEYETRPNTEAFLSNIMEERDDNIDFYHISNAYTYIREWFEAKPRPKDAREDILKTLIFDPQDRKSQGTVQVIWYEIPLGSSPIETFIRINMGKISLTNSELIKALFLQQRNFGGNGEMSRLRQLEIANEWDRIENQLQDDDFWYFLNRGMEDKPSRIEFIFDLMCNIAHKEDSELYELTGDDRFTTFRYFYNELAKAGDSDFIKNKWPDVVSYFRVFTEWFNNPMWYHYIGFLIHTGSTLVDLVNLTKVKGQTKADITQTLKDTIALQYRKVSWLLGEDGYFLNLSYTQNYTIVKEVLLLFNLQYIITQNEGNKIFYRFPFKSFKEEQWDVEHIDSNTENPLKDREVQKQWLTTAVADLKEIEKEPELRERITDFLTQEKSRESFDLLHKDVLILAGDTVNDEKIKNNIGNLTLLDKGTNRGYGNALFPTKRRIIIEKDRKGIFVPVCTKNVFLKYFDLQGSSRTRWGISDIKAYRNILADTLSELLPKPPQKNISNE
jgi:hypothetical protein